MDLENILDHEEKEPVVFYYKKSKKNLIFSITFFVLATAIMTIFLDNLVLNDLIAALGGVLYLASFLFSILGVFNGVKSFIKREEKSLGKWFVLFIHAIVAGIFLYAIIIVVSGIKYDLGVQ